MVILDVREPDEFAAGHVEGAVNYSVQLLLRGILPDIPKDEEVVTYCRSGNRSGMAQSILRQHGFTNVVNAGGLQDMLRAGYKAAARP